MEKVIVKVGEEKPTAKDMQVGGSHYAQMKIQPIDFILQNGIGFCEGNVIKYVCRWKNKNGAEDLRKARHYIDLLLESIEEQKTQPVGYKREEGASDA